MNRQVLRSACSRTRPEVQQAGHAVRDYFRAFSTTQSLDADDDGSSPARRPNVRERGRQTAAEISSFARGRGRGRGSSFGGPTGDRSDGASPSRSGVIDVRSLPSGFRGSGFRGRGGLRGGQGGRGGFRGRGGLGARGRGGGRGRGRGGRGRGGRGEDGDREGGGRPGQDRTPNVKWEADELAFERALAFGERIPYTPNLDVESLREFLPAVPSGSMDHSSTIVDNLNVLGTSDPVGTPQGLQNSLYAEDLDRAGVRFFADTSDKDATELYMQEKWRQEQDALRTAQDAATNADADGGQPVDVDGAHQKQTSLTNSATPAAIDNGDGQPAIRGAEESVKQVILRQAVAGHHEKPKFAQDPTGVARAWHLRAGTYTTKDVNMFEKKLESLLAKAKGGKKVPMQAQGKKEGK